MEKKRGKLSKAEQEFMAVHAQDMSYEEIATHLNRAIETVKDYIENKLTLNIPESKANFLKAQYNIQDSPYWTELKQQFSEEELQMFLFHWGRIISQFKDDVYPTEELQLIDTIKLDILMNRVLKDQRNAMLTIEALEGELLREKAKPRDIPPPSGADIALINEISANIAAHRSAQSALGKSYQDLVDKKEKIIKDLKGTREQRIKRLEDSRQTFIGWMQSLIENRELRRKIGLDMEKMRLAAQVEEKRLSEYHKYEDEQLDQPLLAPETIKDE